MEGGLPSKKRKSLETSGKTGRTATLTDLTFQDNYDIICLCNCAKAPLAVASAQLNTTPKEEQQ